MGEELFESLAGLAASVGNSPCAACDEPSGEDTSMSQDFFAATDESGADDLITQLETALSNLSNEDASSSALNAFSLEQQLESAAFGDENQITLEDILAFAERHPGLKITFSF
ncbi:MAG TPA: hypothetical protein VGW12_08505 [Pyrinomonadaceae bacterium]|nr:hypothetical protein [Pyrinomonadaceae bacterium]